MESFFLQKYEGIKTRFNCPKCGYKQTFARYVDTQGNYIADVVGRCNREMKCGYHLKPTEYFKSKGMSPIMQFSPKKPDVQRSTSYIALEVLNKTLKGYEYNNLVKYLTNFFSFEIIVLHFKRYNIGTTKNGSCIFWQVDTSGKVRGGKVIQYNAQTGKRDKTKYINWVHTILKLENFNLKQCIFGAHLIEDAKSKGCKFQIVESEKTAVISSLFDGIECNTLTLATGGLNNLTVENLSYFNPANVLFIPDNDAFDKWKAKLSNTKFKIANTATLWKDKVQGYDLADEIIQRLDSKKPLEVMHSKNLAFQNFVNFFDLEIIDSDEIPDFSIKNKYY